MNVVFSNAITCMQVDPAERGIFVGCQDGWIRCFYPFGPQGIQSAALNGQIEQTDDQLRLGPTDDNSAVTQLTLSFDGSLLISGDATGQVKIWNISARKVNKLIKKFQGKLLTLLTH